MYLKIKHDKYALSILVLVFLMMILFVIADYLPEGYRQVGKDFFSMREEGGGGSF